MKYAVIAINACWNGDVQQSSARDSFASSGRLWRVVVWFSVTNSRSLVRITFLEGMVGVVGASRAYEIRS